MIRIDSIKQIDPKIFEIDFVSNGRAHTGQIEYFCGANGPNDTEFDTLGSHDAEFHTFIGANREFKDQLFKLVRQMRADKPLALPVEVKEGWT